VNDQNSLKNDDDVYVLLFSRVLVVLLDDYLLQNIIKFYVNNKTHHEVMVILNLDFVVDNYHPIVDDVDYAIDFYNKTKERIFRSNKFSGIKKIRKKLEKKTGH
jgi:hypothetical protein